MACRNRSAGSGPGGNPVWTERVGQLASIVEQSLRQPGGLRGHRRREACDKIECTQHVIRSNGGCQLPNDQTHYRTVSP
jgi:hypothetical protein